MRIRTCALVLMCAALPATAAAETGLLLLANRGTADWNDRLAQLAARVAEQKPAELALGMATRASVESAVERLIKRKVTEIVAIPLFPVSPEDTIAPREYLEGFSIPVRIARAPIDHPLIINVLMERAMEISRDPAGEVLVVAGYAATDPDTKSRWVLNLAPAARQLNASGRFAAVFTLAMKSEAPSTAEQQQLQRIFQRHVGSNRRFIVVPVLAVAGGSQPDVRPWVGSVPYEMAKAGLMPDDRLVDWVLASAGK